MLNIFWTSGSSPRIKYVYIYGCPAQIWDIESTVVRYVGVVQCFFFVKKFKQLYEGYGLVDHESFCIATNEGGTLINVVDLVVVVNTNIWSDKLW